tara:strand:+ start:402 stop:563 length:162 start_codon:yes stop_codon:yes gene_type:complete
LVTTDAEAQFISVIDTLPQAALALVEPIEIVMIADITTPVSEKHRLEVTFIAK